MKIFSLAKSFTSNQVRNSKDGLILTCSGRTIPAPPYLHVENSREQILYNHWLVSQAQQEAEITCDEVMRSRLLSIDANTLDEELRGLLHDYLFGESTPCFGIEGVTANGDTKE